ncbi:MDR family MFS transporter [Natribacillus halophilus]|uniref:Drug resistance transporter, EmrB/QacA subfamily n=1 Tax=Natribacillus halophilus TaxID=549003 RepID=A0A1G8R3N0_9BACI|nr:MDR family MFS transporter [Natribacillus halophilus]SDJ11582.1 drug resistance transporter, EmrB/QacA subfamily [Natribacillus halophilus]
MNEGKKANKWGVLVATLLGGFMVILNNSLMNVALPYFMQLFDITAVEGQWIVTAFALGMAIVMPLTSYLSKRVGRKKIFLLGTLIFFVGSLAGPFSWDFTSMIFFRLLQGFGGGLIMPLTMMLIFKHFPKNERGLALGIWGIAAMVAPTIGPTLGGVLLEFFSWDMLFYINLPTAVVAAGAGLYFLEKDGEPMMLRFDWIGFLFISFGLVAAMIGIDLLQAYPGELWVYGLIAAGVSALVLFIWQELRSDEPLLNIRILRNTVFSGSLIVICFSVMAMFSVLLLVPILIQDIYGYSPLFAGLLLFPQALSMGIAMTIGGRVLDKKGPYIVIMTGVVTTTLSTFAIGFSIGEVGVVMLTTFLVFQGIGNGMINTPASTAGLNALKEEHVPAGSAFNNVSRQLMKVICIVFISIFFEYRRGTHLSTNEWAAAGEQAVQESYLLVAVFLLASIPLVYYLRKRW